MATTRASPPIRIGRTWCCSTSTSTATTAAAWAPAIRPAGPRSCSAASRTWRASGAAAAPAQDEGARPAGGEPAMSAPIAVDDRTEWLEADGLGGFASGTTLGVRTRRYHALLLAATTPPTGRMVLVNGLDAWAGSPRAAAGVSHPPALCAGRARARARGDARVVRATSRGRRGPIAWPTAAGSSTSCSCPHGRARGGAPVAAGRAARRGASLRGAPVPLGPRLARAAPREPGVPVRGRSASGQRRRVAPVRRRAGACRPSPTAATARSRSGIAGSSTRRSARAGWTTSRTWRRRACFQWDLAEGDAVLLLGADGRARRPSSDGGATRTAGFVARSARAARGSRLRLDRAGRCVPGAARPGKDDRRRLSVVHRLGARHVHRAARALSRDRAPGRRAVHPARVGGPGLRGDAAQPLRGPGRRARVQHGGRLAVVRRRRARLSRGALEAAGRKPAARDRSALGAAVQAILDGYVRGTRYGIRATEDGLLAAGEPGVQLTWMDAKVGRLGGDAADRQAGRDPGALAQRAPHRRALHAELRAGLRQRASRASRAGSGTPRPAGSTTWWMPITCRAGSIRRCGPNQILAVGGLPYPAAGRRARPPGRGRRRAAALDPARSPDAGARRGRLRARGTRAAFASATAPTTRARSGPGCWGRSWRPGSGCVAAAPTCGAEARRRFLAAVAATISRRPGLGHISEIADAEPPHTPRGCPFQAWSVGEALRLDRLVLGTQELPQAARRQRAQAVGG